MASKMAKLFAIDEDREEQGVWVDFGEGIRIRIRRLSSKRSIEVRRELDKPFLGQIRVGPLPDSVAEDIMLHQLAKGVISDWEGVDDDDGKLLTYTPDNAFKTLKKYKELRDAVFKVSLDADTYKQQIIEDGEKNSSATSAGV